MKKNLVLTLAVGDVYQKMANYTHPTIKGYAEKIGADFISIDKTNASSAHWEKFQIFHLLNKYERIIYLDTDTIVRNDCPNLFEIVPKESIGLFNEMPFTPQRHLSLVDTCREYGVTVPTWDGKYYNTGVMVISRFHKYLFQKPKKENFSFYEQGYLNMVVAQEKATVRECPLVFDLPYKFNRMTCMDQFTGEERYASYIIHYAGYPNLEFVLSLIQKDLEIWKSNTNGYQYKRHILIDVQGGLGDQVCAEPAIRFMKKHIYPDDDINIKTHFPRLFEHLELPIFTHEEWKRQPDTPYYHIISLPGPDTVMWQCVSNLLCHTIDYCAMALLRRILPLEDKRVRLKVNLEDISNVIDILGTRNLNELILVHPGKHWESKTFPVEWWQEVIDRLVEKKLPVCIIGKDEITRGIHNLKLPDGVIDTRNLLDLGSYIALIGAAGVLISNDSSPIHIAGAFDNYIILIPSCKHPEHVLPFRKNDLSYKAVSLYKRLPLDDCSSAPTEVHGSSGEFLPGNWKDYLPEPEKVVRQAEVFFKDKC